jgi:hypothetical protein
MIGRMLKMSHGAVCESKRQIGAPPTDAEEKVFQSSRQRHADSTAKLKGVGFAG